MEKKKREKKRGKNCSSPRAALRRLPALEQREEEGARQPVGQELGHGPHQVHAVELSLTQVDGGCAEGGQERRDANVGGKNMWKNMCLGSGACMGAGVRAHENAIELGLAQVDGGCGEGRTGEKGCECRWGNIVLTAAVGRTGEKAESVWMGKWGRGTSGGKAGAGSSGSYE